MGDRKYNYYKTKMHKINDSHCSINDLIKLALLIFTRKYFSPLYFNHKRNNILIESKTSISFRLSKKMILTDLILITWVKKLEVTSILSMSFKKLEHLF